MPWIIDTDLIEPEKTRTESVMGPSGISPATAKKLTDGHGQTFRMLDDDGEVYYIGRFLGDPDSEQGFEPLDNYGTPNAGCSEIQYKKGNRWVTL